MSKLTDRLKRLARPDDDEIRAVGPPPSAPPDAPKLIQPGDIEPDEDAPPPSPESIERMRQLVGGFTPEELEGMEARRAAKEAEVRARREAEDDG